MSFHCPLSATRNKGCLSPNRGPANWAMWAAAGSRLPFPCAGFPHFPLTSPDNPPHHHHHTSGGSLFSFPAEKLYLYHLASGTNLSGPPGRVSPERPELPAQLPPQRWLSPEVILVIPANNRVAVTDLGQRGASVSGVTGL